MSQTGMRKSQKQLAMHYEQCHSIEKIDYVAMPEILRCARNLVYNFCACSYFMCLLKTEKKVQDGRL
jgi:hypothetical protein